MTWEIILLNTAIQLFPVKHGKIITPKSYEVEKY